MRRAENRDAADAVRRSLGEGDQCLMGSAAEIVDDMENLLAVGSPLPGRRLICIQELDAALRIDRQACRAPRRRARANADPAAARALLREV